MNVIGDGLKAAGQLAVYAGVVGSLTAGLGYVYGAAIKADRVFAAKAFLIAGVAAATYTFLVGKLVKGMPENNKEGSRFLLLSAGCAIGGAVQTIAFRELNFIGGLGVGLHIATYSLATLGCGLMSLAYFVAE